MKLFLTLASSILVASSALLSAGNCSSCSSCAKIASPPISIITAGELKNMIDIEPSLIVIDARTAQYDNKERIGSAISIPCDSTDTTILTLLPNKSLPIAVYCGSLKCPQGKKLADKLTSLGYTKVYDCTEGLDGWKAMGYPVKKAP